jgi:hypothetical protein
MKAVRTFKLSARQLAGWGRKSAKIRITAEFRASYPGQSPTFSVTADMFHPSHPGSPFCCGCNHDEAARFWPKIKPVIALHLCDGEGAPWFTTENGRYWLEMILGIRPVRTNNPETKVEDILTGHLRISAEELADLVAKAREVSPEALRDFFAAYVDTLRPRWKAEAEAAKKLLQSLALNP